VLILFLQPLGRCILLGGLLHYYKLGRETASKGNGIYRFINIFQWKRRGSGSGSSFKDKLAVFKRKEPVPERGYGTDAFLAPTGLYVDVLTFPEYF